MNPVTGLTYRRAALIVGAVSLVVYANAILNRFAGDDLLVVLQNDRVHSARAALQSWFLGYWPPPWEGAGLYRPFTILSYGIEWSLGGGRPWLFHFDNVVLHAAAAVLVVLLSAAWLPPLGALTAGLLFAVHPVHVESVSNIVGRAELFAALGLLGAMLAARRYRHAGEDATAARWLAAGLVCLAMGLLSKEHAVITIVAIALDHVLDPRPARRPGWNLYLGVAAVTVAWLFLWSAIAGQHVATGANTAFYGVPDSERIGTMMAVQLQLLRLLVFPLELTADYSQQTTPIQTSWGPVVWIGLSAAVSVFALALAVVRRAPPVAFGILLAAASYAPVSNLFFVSGVVLAERALYLAVLAPALAVGWAVARFGHHSERRALHGAVLALLVLLSVRTVTRTPYWKSATNTILEDAMHHPENYRVRIHLAGMYLNARDTVRALAEYLAAGALAENDPFVGQFTVRNAIALGRPNLAVLEGQRVHRLAPDDPRTGRWLLQAYTASNLLDSAVAFSGRDAVRRPESVGILRTYRLALEASEAPHWRLLLLGATDDWLSGRLVQAAARLDSASASLPLAVRAPSFCDDFGIARTVVARIKPATLDSTLAAARRAGRVCEALK